MERHKYERELADLVARERLSSLPYFALASGFLTGKYRPDTKIQSKRSETAWLAAQPTVAAPIASARTTDQLPDLLRVSEIRLSDAELRKLNEASASPGNNGSSS